MTRLAIRKLSEVPVSPVGKVIRSADYQLVLECEESIAAVEQEAEKLYQKAHAEAEILYQKTCAEARSAGESQGQEQATEQLLKTTLGINEYLVAIEQKLATIIVDAVKKIIGDCDAVEAVSGMTGRALYHVRNENRITLQVSPSQSEGIRERLCAVTTNYRNMGVVDVVATPAIVDGACRLETTAGTIDTSIDRQIELLEKALWESLNRAAEV